MADVKFVVVMLICIVLGVSCIGAGLLLSQKEAEVTLKTEEIVVMETQKSTLETQIVGLLSDKAALELQVTGLEDETSELNTEVTVLESEVSGLETEVTENYNQGYSEGHEAGYAKGYVEGMDYVTENGYYIRDPTYAEAIEFIASDLTDQHEYSDYYVCYDFTSDFNANAEDQGYRCGFVYMTFSSGAHAIACFSTVDEGIIYVEPQTDEIVAPKIGQIYNGDMVETLGIIW
jgi:hypothetical protein